MSPGISPHNQHDADRMDF